MTVQSTSGALRRSARLGLAGVMVVVAVQGAAASDDDGVRSFFSSVFGGAAAQPPAIAPSQQGGDAASESPAPARRSRPLTVRLRRTKPAFVASQGPTKPIKVSIFEDRTLRPGDAVMTPHGVRIFAGSGSWPYTPADFVGLDEARHLSHETVSTFAALDRLPRG